MAEWKSIIRSWIKENKVTKTTVNQICIECLKQDKHDITVKDRKDIVNFLKSIGWESKSVRIDGEVQSGWVKVKPAVLDKLV